MSLTKLALAMRQSSLVVERVEGMRDGIETTRFLMCYNYRRREEALFQSRSAVDQRTVNPCVGGSIPPSGAISESLIGKCLTSSQTIMVRPDPVREPRWWA